MNIIGTVLRRTDRKIARQLLLALAVTACGGENNLPPAADADLLLPDASAEQAVAIAERLVKLFGQYSGRLGRKDAVSMSAGVASLRGDGCESGHALVNRADIALYAAKRGGKNTVSRSPSTHPLSVTRIPAHAGT